MARKKKHGHSGGHGWFVTFADLMGLLMAFFVMLAAYSTMDKQKLYALMGSMRDAFGSTTDARRAGVVEIGGTPNREFLQDLSNLRSEGSLAVGGGPQTNLPLSGPERMPSARVAGPTLEQNWASAAATLRQAWQDLPEVSAISHNIQVEATPDGLAIRLVDQDGRSMFPEGSRFPFERTRAALQALGPVLARLPNRITVTGHTSARPIQGRAGYTNWDLSADRANAVRQVLMESGVRPDRFAGVTGKADSEPVFPQDPTSTTNGRVTILLMPDTPPMPPRHQP